MIFDEWVSKEGIRGDRLEMLLARKAWNAAMEEAAKLTENYGAGQREFYGVRQEIAYAIRELK